MCVCEREGDGSEGWREGERERGRDDTAELQHLLDQNRRRRSSLVNAAMIIVKVSVLCDPRRVPIGL